MKSLQELNVHIYADGADKAGMLELNAKPYVRGLTTNPTLMRKAGITDYEAFARDILQSITEKPISLEVFADDFDEMRRQARKIATWGNNVYVKIPITNTKAAPSYDLIHDLSNDGIKLNVTAILSVYHVDQMTTALNPSVPSVVSVFAGRIADTGIDPMPIMAVNKHILSSAQPKAQLLWASVREVLNIYQADKCGCDIVTVPHDILTKAVKMSGTDLIELSLDTVRMFARDAEAAGYRL